MQANQRVEEFKTQLKELKFKLKIAEKRAVIAEKTVKIFAKEMDKREGEHNVIFVNSKFLNFTKINNINNKLYFILQIICRKKRKNTNIFATIWIPRSRN